MPGRGARGGVDTRRAAAVLLLLAVAAAGLRAGGAFSAAGNGNFLGMTGNAMYWVLVISVSALAAAGLVMFVVGLFWRARGGDERTLRKRRSVWWVLVLPFVVFGLARILAKLREHKFAPHSGTLAGAGAGAGPPGGGHHATPGSPWPVFVLFAVVALTAGALTVWRHRRAVTLVFAETGPDAVDPLADALAAGEQALHGDPDPRTAIIGCYAAMERSLADAGSPAKAADTPTEVLARATAGGVVRSTWAGTLTGLFRRARYSSHPMTEADRAAAMGALDQVRADLEGAS
jgi:hypothetical protein